MKRFALLASLSLLLLIGFALPARAQTEWTCTYNFLLSNGGFTTSTFSFGSSGTWSPGVGWIGEFGVSEGDSYHMVQIVKAIPTSHITFMEVYFEINNGTQGAGAIPLALSDGVVNLGISSTPPPDGPGTFSAMGDRPAASTLSLRVQSGFQAATSADPGGDVVVQQLTVSGLGEPPSGEPCDDEEETFEASFDAMPETGTAPLTVLFTNTSVGNSINHWDFGDGNTYNGPGDPMHIYEVPGIYTATLTIEDGGERIDSYEKTITVQEPLDGDFFKPLNAADADTSLLYPPDQDGLFDLFYADEANTLNAGPVPIAVTISTLPEKLKPQGGPADSDKGVVTVISNAPNKPIHAIAGGTVTSVVAAQECGGIRCKFIIPASLSGSFNNTILRAEINDVYAITVAVEGREIRYLVKTPQVQEGDEITAGCIIGYTMEAVKLTNWELQGAAEEIGGSISESGEISASAGGGVSYTLTSRIVTYGISFLRFVDGGETIPLLEELDQDPTSLTPCNADPNHRTCQGDASLAQPELWTKTGGVVWPTGSKPVLSPGGSITEQLALSPDIAYSMTVQARGAGRLTLQIGKTTQTFNTAASILDYKIDAAMHEADTGLFYSVSVLNAGSSPMEIVSVCVAVGDGDVGASTCVFKNPSLDGVGDRWSYGGGVYQGLQDGELAMTDEATLSQVITLYPSTYTLTLRTTVTGASQTEAITSTLGFEWQFDGGAWTDFEADDGNPTLTFASFTQKYIFAPGETQPANGLYERVFTASIPIASVTNGAFVIRAKINLDEGFDPTGGAGLALVREICIPSDTGGGNAGGGGGPLPYDPSCASISTGTDENVSTWTIFLWRSLDRFFRCDLIIAINKGLTLGQDILSFLRWQLLWWQSYIAYFSQWIGDSFVPWMNGHFANIARANGAVIVQQEGGGVGFWDVLLAIINRVVGPIIDLVKGLIEKVFDLLLDVMRRFIDLIFRIIGMIFDLIATILTWIKALAYAWNNAAPANLSWLPDCNANPQQAFCIPSWIAENTIFSGLGSAIIPLLVSIEVIDLILWAIFRLSGSVKEAGEVS